MIASPDLVPFTGTEGFGDGEEDRGSLGLPEELSVPLWPPSNPWSTSAQFNRDFILLAEFSEQVGPKPVLTIPDHPRVIGSFDLNHFSVRIMSVDYQASGPGHAPPASPGPRLNFSEDSRVILGDSADDAFAYVHHMTLYDLEARGMVRPFCVAYVCSDQAKLMENLSELSACFCQAADSLKTGNRQACSMELQRKLQELEFTRLTLLQEAELPPTEDGSAESGAKMSEELEAVERSISNHRDLLRQVTSYPNRKLKQPDFLPYDPADSLSDPTAMLPPEPCPPVTTTTTTSITAASTFSSSFNSSEDRLKPLQELCNSYFLSLMKEQLADTERRLRGDRSILRNNRVTRSLSRKLTPINFLFELWAPEEGDEDEDEAEAELQRGETTTTAAMRRSEAEPMSLESFCSCVEEIPIKLEAGEEAGTVTPDLTVATEMTESVSSGDSIEVLGTEKSYRTQQVVAGSDNRETPTGILDFPSRRPVVDSGVRRVRAYARRANSEDSIEVLSITESIFLEDLTAITEEEAEHPGLSNGFEDEEESEFLSEDVLTGETTPEEMMPEETTPEETVKEEEKEGDGDVDREETIEKTTVGGEDEEEEVVMSVKKQDSRRKKLSILLQVEAAVDLKPRWSDLHHSVPDLQVTFAPSVPPAEVDHLSPPCPPLRLLSIDEASDCTSFTGSSDPPSPTQNSHGGAGGGGGSRSRQRRRRKAGLRALRFLKQYSFSQHAVFSLLSGRPLVVIGGDEGLVRKLVDGLSLFLPAPGPDGNAVMPILATPLQLTDLLTWRLIGIHRSSSTPVSSILHSLSRYSRYLALLDLDQRTLHSPSYSGALIPRLANPHTGISRGNTYLLHLESCLTALSNQVLLSTFRGGGDAEKGAGDEDFLLTRGFCSSDDDVRVMHFLSDLVRQRHAGRGPPVLRFSYASVHMHKNTYAA